LNEAAKISVVAFGNARTSGSMVVQAGHWTWQSRRTGNFIGQRKHRLPACV
jgi:hypothetical protein